MSCTIPNRWDAHFNAMPLDELHKQARVMEANANTPTVDPACYPAFQRALRAKLADPAARELASSARARPLPPVVDEPVAFETVEYGGKGGTIVVPVYEH